jgi:hypothetical protein
MMDTQEIKQGIERVEACADQAKGAMQSGSVPQDLQERILDLHQQASRAKHAGSRDETMLRQTVMQLEQAADRAMQACRQAGSSVDAKTQQAVQRAHDELSSLKKQMQAGSMA